MAIQNRRGLLKDLDTDRLLPGEVVTTSDEKGVYACFTAGDTRKMATYEDMVKNIEDATIDVANDFSAEVQKATQSANNAADSANAAANNANANSTYAKEQGDYAKAQGDLVEGMLGDKIQWDAIQNKGIGYGTCSTAAGTAAKVATIDNFSVTTGAIVGILFTNGSTSTVPTLNINSTGAKPIHYDGAYINATMITAGMTATLVYNGTAWVLVYPASLPGIGLGYGTCATSAATVAKVGTLAGFKRKTGSFVALRFTYANTAASPTLNVNSTGAAAIYYNGVAITSGMITAGMTASFVFNGTQWVLLSPAPETLLPNGTLHGTCATAAATAAKAGVLSNFVLKENVIVHIRFTYASTATNPTLNVNSTGAKPIYHNGTNITSGMITAGMMAKFRYNGTQWELLNPEPVALNNKITTLESKLGDVYLEQGSVVLTGNGSAHIQLFSATQLSRYGENPTVFVTNGAADSLSRHFEGTIINNGALWLALNASLPAGQYIRANYGVMYSRS